MKYAFLVLILLKSIVVYSQTYKGTIGNHEIFLQLDLDYSDDRITGLYFYKNHLNNIPLEGTYNKPNLVLHERYYEENERFTLHFENENIYGKWQHKGVTLNVKLIKTNIDTKEYKLERLNLERDSIAIYDYKEIVWFTEKYSQEKLFRLGNGFTKSQREYLNPILDSIHTEFSMTDLECSWADIFIQVEFISNQYISFSESGTIYCGGAHPSHYNSGYNFDIKNKKRVKEINDIYPKLDYYQLLKNKYKNDSDLQEECEYFTDSESYWEYCSWVLSNKGMTITPYFPHAMTPCRIGFFLTYEELNVNK